MAEERLPLVVEILHVRRPGRRGGYNSKHHRRCGSNEFGLRVLGCFFIKEGSQEHARSFIGWLAAGYSGSECLQSDGMASLSTGLGSFCDRTNALV